MTNYEKYCGTAEALVAALALTDGGEDELICGLDMCKICSRKCSYDCNCECHDGVLDWLNAEAEK